MAIYASSLMIPSLRNVPIRETEARGDIRRTSGFIPQAVFGAGVLNDVVVLARVKWNSSPVRLVFNKLNNTDLTAGAVQVGVWGYAPDQISVTDAGVVTGGVLDLDLFGTTALGAAVATTPGGLLTGPSCLYRTTATGAGAVVPFTGYSQNSWMSDSPFGAAVDLPADLQTRTARGLTFKQIVTSLGTTDANNWGKAAARKVLFTGEMPYSTTDCLICARITTVFTLAVNAGPFEYEFEYIEGTVSNMVNSKTAPTNP
jgi:hypothetical protein